MGEFAGGFMGLEDADAGELDVLTVREHLDGAGGEPARIPAVSLPFPPRETDWAAFAAAAARVAPVLQRPRKSVQARLVGLLGVSVHQGAT
jgi:hypothetical protein